jgi:hypothetical protein
MNINTQITNKQLDFISDVDLRKALLERLDELDRVFLVNANYSTVFGSLGAIEGIFRHIALIYKDEILSSSTYPRTRKGNKKEFNHLTLDELYIELKTLEILPDISEYEHLYKLFRNYRNCIHPQEQVLKGWKIDLGQAQMAIGLLNATTQNLDRNIFIGKHIFEKVAGNPYYDSKKVLQLEFIGTPHNSFLILKRPISQKLLITFDVDLPQGSLLNFVFNFVNEGDFKMLRLDNRRNRPYPNAVLRSSQKYSWNVSLRANPLKPPDIEQFPVRIDLDFSSRLFEFIVNNVIYTFEDLDNKTRHLFDEIHQNRRVGFFNEVGIAKLSNIEIEVD